MRRRHQQRRALLPVVCPVLIFLLGVSSLIAQGQRGGRGREIVPTLGLDRGVQSLDAPSFELDLVRASQTVAALRPRDADGFDFTPSDRLERRNGDGFYHLGDINLRLHLLLAGHALSLDATLVTNNVDEFRRVDGLQVESWAA